MLQANKLRIGNCINHNNEQCIVFSLSKEWLRVTKDRHIAISYDNISGIPITEDWLLKFGFIRIGKDGFWFNNGVYLNWNIEGFCIAMFHRRSSIKHVHQLQNLYLDLTEEELKLN